MPPRGEPDSDDFGAAFTALLDAAGLNPDRLLRVLGRQHQPSLVTRATLYDWKSGKHLPEDSAVFLAVTGACLRCARERGCRPPIADDSGWLSLLAAARRSRDSRGLVRGSGVPAHDRDGLVAGDEFPRARAEHADGLYKDALEQLGGQAAIVRIGGLHALGRLGQDNPDLRQSIIDVICAYLRMPYPGTGLTSEPNNSGQVRVQEELQVRLIAQGMLSRHLRDEDYTGQRHSDSTADTFWPGMDLIDLTGAHLVSLNLSHCRFRAVNCNDATFVGETLFRALLCDVGFIQNADFGGHTDFRGASFAHAWFSYSSFACKPWFHSDEFYSGASFGRHADFRNVTFTAGARFDQAIFGGSADFTDVSCEACPRAVSLEGARVLRPGTLSPDVARAPSTWPAGWRLQPGTDGTSTLVWHGTYLATRSSTPRFG